ncbi:MAG: acyl-CoA thioesterase [Planctomycetota bacterium]|nr:MAG: acyl-CoA thioesterase [Planctomycetota bacterium]
MPREFFHRRRVQFVETDTAGVMHFSNYFRWMEECETEFWRAIGLSVHGWPDFTWPRVSARCEYRRPAHFDDELEVRLRVAHIGEKSIRFELSFFRAGEQIASGETSAVCCAQRSGRFQSIPIPDEIRTRLAEWAATP